MATIITKNSQTASAVPSAASLSVGELAVNTADGKLYTEHTGGVVKEIIPSTVVDGGITEAKIASNAVTTAKVADGAITSAKIADGTIATADLANSSVTVAKISASGSPSSSTFLRGDGSWQAAGVSTTYGDIGTYVVAYDNTYDILSNTSPGLPNVTIAGSNLLRYTGQPGTTDFNPAGVPGQLTSLGLSGTWRRMSGMYGGNYGGGQKGNCLFVRVS
jgi:hypothetical protein